MVGKNIGKLIGALQARQNRGLSIARSGKTKLMKAEVFMMELLEAETLGAHHFDP